MNHSAVSVIIPAYNAEKFICRCIDSVIEDELVTEIIVVDDGSKDRTVEVISKRYTSKKVIILFHPDRKNRGACASRNLGVVNSSNKWIQFLDADDVIIPPKYERQVKMAEKMFADVIFGSFVLIQNNSEKQIAPSSDDIWISLINFKLGCTNSNLWRREFVLSIGGWNESWPSNQDYEFYFRALRNNVKYGFDFVPSAKYIKRMNSISTIDGNEGWERQIQIRIDIGNYLYANKRLNFKRSLAIHSFLFNKFILLSSAKDLKKERDYLYNKFNNASWFKTVHLSICCRRAFLHLILGGKIAEALINKIRRRKFF